MALHIHDVPPEVFVDGHKHFRGIIIPTVTEGQFIGKCAVCPEGTVWRTGPRQTCDRCGSPTAHHPDPEALLHEKGLGYFLIPSEERKGYSRELFPEIASSDEAKTPRAEEDELGDQIFEP